jgi:hypothetical protein
MPITALEKDTLARSFAVSKTLLNDLQPKLQGLNEIFNSEGGVKTTLEQADLDELAELSGLTVEQVSAGLNALTVVILPAISSNYPFIAQLAARFL